MSTNVGIRKGGLNLSTCNIIFWTVVVPTLIFGCETWVLKNKDCQMLSAFQRYAARRLQRLHARCLNITSIFCLGWMDIVLFIKAKKIIFVRTILSMNECMLIRRVFLERLNSFNENCENKMDSPIVQILKYCHDFGLMAEITQMANGHHIEKGTWKKKVWKKAWEKEKAGWEECMHDNVKLDLLALVASAPIYAVWWELADKDQKLMKRCELMVRLLCHSSGLKGDDNKLSKASFSDGCCTMCQLASIETARHMIMECPAHEESRVNMYNALARLMEGLENRCTFATIMGKPLEGWEVADMKPIWQISCSHISKMYYRTINERG